MATRLGLLAGSVDFSNAAADEFHDWLDTEHIPERTCRDGILNAVRWLGVENPKASLVIYDLESLDVLSTPEYLAVSFENFSPWSKRMLNGSKTKRITRFACEQIWPGDRMAPDDAGGLAVFAMNVAPEVEAEFNRWYDGEHIPAIVAVPGVLCARRYMSRGGTDHKYVTLVHLESSSVCDAPAWKLAMTAPSAIKMQEHMTQKLHMVMRRYVRTN
jgi:hypothetical protein